MKRKEEDSDTDEVRDIEDEENRQAKLKKTEKHKDRKIHNS